MIIDSVYAFPQGTFGADDNGMVTCDMRIQAAICEQANWLLNCDPIQYPTILTLGLASASAAGASMSVDPNMVAPLVCPTSRSLIGDLGEYYNAGTSTANITCFPLANSW